MQDLSGIRGNLPVDVESLRNRKDPEAIKAAAREMEAMFAYELLKVMRESSGELSKGSFGGDTYTSMFDMELSKVLANRGLGLTEELTKGLLAKEAAAKSSSSRPVHAPVVPARTQVSGLTDAENAEVSSGYGMRTDPISGIPRFHEGIDIAAPEGSGIHPLRPGTVVFSGEQAGYGNVVVIDHGDGFRSTYAHNEENLVQAGDRVDSGTVIARVGSTGRSTGPHMHFELAYNGRNVNPGTLLF